MIGSYPPNESLILCGDLNGHINVMGNNGYGTQNDNGLRILIGQNLATL